MSMRIPQDFVVHCTPEQAFDFLSDLANEPKWNPDHCESVERTSEGPIGVGTTYRAKWRGGPEVRVEYTEYERPRFWRAHSDGSLQSRFQCRIEPHEDGARVISELELVPHGLFRLFFPIFRMFFAGVDDYPDKMRSTLHAHYGVAKASA